MVGQVAEQALVAVSQVSLALQSAPDAQPAPHKPLPLRQARPSAPPSEHWLWSMQLQSLPAQMPSQLAMKPWDLSQASPSGQSYPLLQPATQVPLGPQT